ncbi:MAG: ferritin-like domain-containing protein [Ilumatobacter sp.]|uniref:ferritin-like domain-containing protein n=1 Tax=Ilumatobacter sp. TaxID=1967498 RepID=UPI002623F5EA|nr:ferritin-like domain-containing protein [Ilumatobacter sp.]MDJ0767875.1 ferritin-like domain-containing protein [Ilumatobacter sp.]
MTDAALADDAAPERSSRRALLGAGVIGAAMALARSGTAAASTSGLSDDDLAQVGFAISLELTARDLYDAAIAGGADDPLWGVMREQHEAYAQRLAGISGISADTRNDAVYDALEGAFTAGDPAGAAFDLENTAAATHVELLGAVSDPEPAAAIASIAAIESRHATVLAGLSGQGGDFDALFLNTATALSPEA